jgi:hypothetical protein
MVENFGSRPSIVSKISLAALFQGAAVQLLRTVAGTGPGSHRRPVDRTFVANRGSIGEKRVGMLSRHGKVLVTFSLAGRGNCTAAFRDPPARDGSALAMYFASQPPQNAHAEIAAPARAAGSAFAAVPIRGRARHTCALWHTAP